MSHTIEDLDLKGFGIGPGIKTPVPRVLPEERVQWDEGGHARILTPSEHRVSAPCRHYKSCGGCSLQHASAAFVADWKTQVIERGLAAHGIETDIRMIKTSPVRSRRRATLHGRRTKKGATLGFFNRASDQLADVIDCHVLEPSILEKRAAFLELTQLLGTRSTTISYAITVTENGLDVDVLAKKELDRALNEALVPIAAAHNFARISLNGETVATLSPPSQNFDRATVIPPAGGFLQATKYGEQDLTEAVLEIASGSSRVADLFAGCGTFTLPLLKCAEVIAVEGLSDLTNALEDAWRKTPGLKTLSVQTRDLFRQPLLPDEVSKLDCLVLDPPRPGAAAQVTEICKARVPRIAYVSCNPVTFARDAKALTDAGYRLEWIQPVDQFRWSAHIELVGCFKITTV